MEDGVYRPDDQELANDGAARYEAKMLYDELREAREDGELVKDVLASLFSFFNLPYATLGCGS